MRFILIFLLASASLFAFFYFYPAAIFQVTVSGEMAQVTTGVSLETVFFSTNYPPGIVAENVTSADLTFQGMAILFICLAGLPLMIAYRFSKAKTD